MTPAQGGTFDEHHWGISVSTIKAVTKTKARPHVRADRGCKSRILDVLVELTVWHRDYARTGLGSPNFTVSALYSGVNSRRCLPMVKILSYEVSSRWGQGQLDVLTNSRAALITTDHEQKDFTGGAISV